MSKPCGLYTRDQLASVILAKFGKDDGCQYAEMHFSVRADRYHHRIHYRWSSLTRMRNKR